MQANTHKSTSKVKQNFTESLCWSPPTLSSICWGSQDMQSVRINQQISALVLPNSSAAHCGSPASLINISLTQWTLLSSLKALPGRETFTGGGWEGNGDSEGHRHTVSQSLSQAEWAEDWGMWPSADAYKVSFWSFPLQHTLTHTRCKTTKDFTEKNIFKTDSIGFFRV